MNLTLTLPALERLIAGDAELEVNLKQVIVAQFVERNLKGIANEAIVQAAAAATRAYIDEAAKQAFDIGNLTVGHEWPTVGYRVKQIVETEVKAIINKTLEEVVTEYVARHRSWWLEEIVHRVKAGMDSHIEAEIKKGIQARLEQAAKG